MIQTEKYRPGKVMVFFLFMIMFFKIYGFFTLFETNLALTRVTKTFMRLAMTGFSLYLLYYIQARAGNLQMSFKNAMPVILYAAYLILGYFSMFWSSGVGHSALQLSMVTDLFVFSLIYYKLFLTVNELRKDDPVRLSSIIAVATFLISAWMLFGLMTNPDRFYRHTHGGEVARLGGDIMNPNEMGMLAAVGTAMALFEINRKNKVVLYTFISIVLVITLYLTGSRSSLGGLFLIAALYIVQMRSVALKVISVGAVVAVTPFLISTVILKMGDLEEVLSLTGRLPFWKALILEGWPREPFLGYGFMRISYEEKFYNTLSYAGAMTHNTFLQVLMNLGMIGMLIVILQMLSTFREYLREMDKDVKLISFSLYIPIFINSLTEFGIFGETNFGILFYLMIVVMHTMRLQPRLSGQERLRNKIVYENSRKRLFATSTDSSG